MAEKKSTEKTEKLEPTEKIEKVEKTPKEKPVKIKETAKNDPKLSEFDEYKEKIKDWYETDSAKATATVIAILLIPGAVLAWNYFSQQDNIRTRGLIGDEGQSTSIYDENNGSNSEGTTFTEMFQNNDQQNPTDMDPATPKPTSLDLLTDITNNGMNNDSLNGNNNQNPNTQVEPTPNINEVKKLPNTSSAIYYKVRRGDNFYKISRKICGNESFYKKNLSHNYLREGIVIRVTCY